LLRRTSVGSPLAHAEYLHGAGKGQVTIGQKTNLESPNHWFQHSDSFENLAPLLPSYEEEKDVYISQNRFYGSRATSRLAQLSALYTDLDYYKCPGLTEMPPPEVLELAFDALTDAQIPRPSFAVATGRGLALVWRHEAVPKAVLSKWSYCQDRIFEVLKHLGADAAAKDAARVLRLVGTYNSKSGTLVESIWENLDFIPDFGELADQILPLPREEFEAQRAARLGAKSLTRDPTKPPERPREGQKGFGLTSLHETRLRDLRHLLELRGMDKLPPGNRDSWMFVAAVSLSYLLEPRLLEMEVVTLGREVAGWSERETRARMQAVLARAYWASEGQVIEWKGQQRHALYWLTNEEIINRLKITSEEEKHLETIISKETKQQRDRERKRRERRAETLISKETKQQRDRERKQRERRAAGAPPREDYLASARERKQYHRQQAKKLRAEGKSLRDIADVLGISHTEVGRLLRTSE
jgi:hypothetical protein